MKAYHSLLLLSSSTVRATRSAFVNTNTQIIIRPSSSLSLQKQRRLPFSVMSLRKNRITSSSSSSTTTNTIRGGSTSSSSSTELNSTTMFNNTPFWTSTKIISGANFLGFLINLVAPHAHYHVDLLGTGAFALAAIPNALNTSNTNQRIQWSTTAVITWSVKLASFLFYRVLNTGHDSRLDEQLSTPTGAAGFWLISTLWGLLCSLPYTLGTTSKLSGNPLALRSGAVMFSLGFIIETLADYQKWIFKQSNPGELCTVGVWSISQHPNWFGNLLLWSGIFVMNAPALIEPTSSKATLFQKIWSYRRFALGLIGPTFMWLLFDAQATGKILMDSIQANRNKYGYGTNPHVTNYIDNTPLIIPNPFK